jgi:hypothetical protein
LLEIILTVARVKDIKKKQIKQAEKDAEEERKRKVWPRHATRRC